ncbi:Hypothetical predicted protein [Pelobates cultripes]|uniref:Uncharacterized protein n=1 Tax=Pelobates cultripes TaxID=61616 RepID=A0AAD1W6U0_PELCU|nr:Hypothetical predicted protein [Pelobates cultripes]
MGIKTQFGACLPVRLAGCKPNPPVFYTTFLLLERFPRNVHLPRSRCVFINAQCHYSTAKYCDIRHEYEPASKYNRTRSVF